MWRAVDDVRACALESGTDGLAETGQVLFENKCINEDSSIEKRRSFLLLKVKILPVKNDDFLCSTGACAMSSARRKLTVGSSSVLPLPAFLTSPTLLPSSPSHLLTHYVPRPCTHSVAGYCGAANSLDFALQMMDFALKTMSFVLKVMDSVGAGNSQFDIKLKEDGTIRLRDPQHFSYGQCLHAKTCDEKSTPPCTLPASYVHTQPYHNVALKTMRFSLKMMSSVFKMMNSAFSGGDLPSSSCSALGARYTVAAGLGLA